MKLSILLLACCLSLATCQSFPYSETLAKDLAGFSLASYCNQAQLQEWNCGFACELNPDGITDFKYFYDESLEASGYLAYSVHHQAILIVFRGTLQWEIKNWFTNFDQFRDSYQLCENCKVHKGFFKQYNQLKPQIVSAFTEIRQKYPSSKIFVTGHSLGAAVGFFSIPTIYELNGNQPIDAFYNYGSPRVGNKNYATWFNQQNFALEYGRITNGADPVPHLPSKHFPLWYYHSNHEIYYTSFQRNGNQYEQCLDAESYSCASRNLIAISVYDHLNYFEWDWKNTILNCQ